MLDTIDVTRVIILDSDKNILFERRAIDCSNNPGLWEIPGGKVDAGEHIVQAGLREVSQETGQTGLRVLSTPELVREYEIPDGRHAGKICRQLFMLASASMSTASPQDECDAVRWLSYADAMEQYQITENTRIGLEKMASKLILLSICGI